MATVPPLAVRVPLTVHLMWNRLAETTITPLVVTTAPLMVTTAPLVAPKTCRSPCRATDECLEVRRRNLSRESHVINNLLNRLELPTVTAEPTPAAASPRHWHSGQAFAYFNGPGASRSSTRT